MDNERHEEINNGLIEGEDLDLDIAETMERAVNEEVEEEEVDILAHENCTPEDYS